MRLSKRVHWIAYLKSTGRDIFAGRIWYKDGDVSFFPYTEVKIKVTRSLFVNQRKAAIEFSGGGAAIRKRTLLFRSQYFHPIAMEFDTAEGTTAVTTYRTNSHPNRPPSLPAENLSIETVYRRVGFDVSRSGDNIIPISGAGPNARWSDAEMHDAMQTYWSKFANAPKWAMWVFFASLHEMGTSLGGIMFDDIGPNHRQGTAIFEDSFISTAPPGDPASAAWVNRMRFWTACHEMGHSFNLAHSWQKSLGTPWIPLPNEPEARSFMNYPYNVAGGQAAFFADFQFCFSKGELLFVRHAPTRFVQPGNADWFDHHGFQQANVSAGPPLKLEIRANRAKPVFEYLEPTTLELKLTNISSGDLLIEKDMLSSADHMTVIIKKDNRPARQHIAYAQTCPQPGTKVLERDSSEYESLFISAGINGWDLAEPGNYTIQACLHFGDIDIVSNAFRIRVSPPMGFEEEVLAQDFFSDEVGRILAFDGSMFFAEGNDVLRSVAERLKDRKVALHALVALGNPLTRQFKQLVIQETAKGYGAAWQSKAKIDCAAPNHDVACKDLTAALTARKEIAAETLGHIDYRYYTERFAAWMADEGSISEAARIQDDLLGVLTGRKVTNSVLAEIKTKASSYKRKG
jgi:hypothetical protein